MTTDLAPVDEFSARAPLALTSPPMTGDLASDPMIDWLDRAERARQFARAIARSHFVPKSFKPTDARPGTDDWFEIVEANMTGAILLGQSLGVPSPLVALQNIFVVDARPSMYAKFKKALLEARGFDIWTEQLDDETATVAGRRPGWPDERFERRTITWAMAERAGWANKDTYRKTPQDMLYARALGRVCDAIGSDVLLGIPTFDDVEDRGEDVPARDVSVTTAARPDTASVPNLRAALEASTLRREAEASVALDRDETAQTVALPNEPAPQPQPEPSPPIEQLDWRKLMARFNELGVNGLGRDSRRLQVMSAIVGREITRGNELTKDEAQLILDNLAGEAGARTVAAALGEDEPRAATQDVPPLPGEDDQAGDELDQRDAELDPAKDPDDYREGRPAALEGAPDPWGINS